MELKITAKATPVNKDGIVARISFNISDAIYINGCTMRQGKNGIFLSMPSWKGTDGKYHDYVYGASKASQDRLLQIAADAYKNAGIETADKEEKLPF